MNTLDARRHVRVAAALGVLLALLSAAAVTLAIAGVLGSGGPLDSPAHYVDVGLVLALSAFVARGSRLASCSLLVYFVLAKAYTYSQYGRPTTLGLLLLGLFFFGRAVRASFFLQRERASAGFAGPVTIWKKIGIGTALLVAAFIVLGAVNMIAISLGHIPDSAVQAGESIPDRARKKLEDLGVVGRNEQIVLYQPYGILSFAAGGCLLTTERLVTYPDLREGGSPQSMPLKDVEDVFWEAAESALDLSVISVVSVDGAQLNLVVSPEAGGDDRFLELLQRRSASSADPLSPSKGAE